MIDGLVVIRCLDLKNKFLEDVRKAAYNNLKAWASYFMVVRHIQFLVELTSNVVISLNVMIIVLWRDLISPETAAVSLAVNLTLINGLYYFILTIIEVENYMASTQRIHEYSSLPKEGKYRSDSNFKITTGEIQVKNVTLRLSLIHI